MAKTLNIFFKAFLAVRITLIVLSVITVAGIIASVITIGVVMSRVMNKTSVTRMVVQADISVAIERLIASYELQQFYDKPATLQDTIKNLNAQLKEYFPNTFVKVVISSFSGQPILISDIGNKRKKRLDGRTSLVVFNGTIYFLQNHTKADISTALKNYTQMITLITETGTPNTALATILFRYSVFTDTYPTNLTEDTVKDISSINVNNLNNSAINATLTSVRSTSASTNPNTTVISSNSTNVTNSTMNTNSSQGNNSTYSMSFPTDNPLTTSSDDDMPTESLSFIVYMNNSTADL
jgi:hypothetical protein